MLNPLQIDLEPLPKAEQQDLEPAYEALYRRIERKIRSTVRAKGEGYRQVTVEYLDVAIEDGQVVGDTILFSFRDMAGYCEMASTACSHWFQILLAEVNLNRFFKPYGYRVQGDRPSLKDMLDKKWRTTLLHVQGDLYCVETDEGEPYIYSDYGVGVSELSELPSAAQNTVRKMAKTGVCACAVCETYRGKVRKKKTTKKAASKSTKKKTTAKSNKHLQAEIIANPGDDIPRLVFADWIEENGQSDRAEFIRLQCELAQTSKFDPKYDEIDYRQDQLWNMHHAEWNVRLGGSRHFFTFRRGFPSWLTMEASRFVREGAELKKKYPLQELELWSPEKVAEPLSTSPILDGIRHLTLASMKGKPARQILSSPHLSSLQSLNLERGEIGLGGLKMIASEPHLQNIRDLDLNNNSVKANWFQSIEKTGIFARLESLYLSFCHCGSGVLDLLSSGNETRPLRSLDFRFNGKIDESTIRSFAESAVLSNLEELELSQFDANAEKISMLAGSTRLSKLKSLHLDLNTGESVKALGNGSGLPALRELHVRNQELGDALVEHLGSTPLMSRLLGLEIDVDLTTSGAKRLADSDCSMLRSLDVSSNLISDEGISAIANSPTMANLRKLDFGYNSRREYSVGDQAAIAVAESPHLRQLTSLDFFSNNVSDDGIIALANSPNLQHVVTLSIGANEIGDAGMQALIDSKYLHPWTQVITFGNDLVSESMKEALQERFSNCITQRW